MYLQNSKNNINVDTYHRYSLFLDVADLPEGGFIVATPEGMDDNHEGWGSFNCSSTDGPLGPVCDTNRTR